MADGELVGPGKVAVVTGAASGIGLGLCARFAAAGMRVVMADVESPALSGAAAELSKDGADVLAVVTDVANSRDVEALRDRALSAFGAVHVVCNNAGVGGSTEPLWTIPLGEWEWVLGVNLWGVIHGTRTFLPVLLDQGEGHMVNTASIFGVFAGALGPYGVSKHAVVALTETVSFQLRDLDTPVGVSVLCPGAVRTNFGTSNRNRPVSAGPVRAPGPDQQAFQEKMSQITAAAGRPPAEVAEIVVDAIRTQRFYVLTSTNRNEAVRRRAEEILAGGPPAPPMP